MIDPNEPDDLDQRRERRQIERDRAEAKVSDPLLAALWDNGGPRRTRGTLSPAMIAKIKARGASRRAPKRA